MMNDNTRLVEMVAEAVEMKLAEEDGIAEMSLTAMEQKMRVVLMEVGRQAIERMVANREPKYAEVEVGCECGGEAKYVRRRSGQLQTTWGKMAITRAYYLCAECKKGTYPLDNRLGLRPNALSAELERIAAVVGVQVPFGKGSDLLKELMLLSLSDMTIAKASRAIGRKIQEREADLKQQAQDSEYLLRQAREEKQPLRLYGAIDAGKVQIRGESQHGWRDLKLGAWFEAAGKPPKSPDNEWRIAAQNIEYYADICPSSEFSSLVWATAVRRNANLARELILLGDGAEWIWNIVEECFPDAVQILDWFHASEHLTPVADAAFDDPDQRKQWIVRMRQHMWDGETQTLIAACRTLAARFKNDDIRRAADYFETHQFRMRYAWFRKQGYQIGSGTIESAAKQIGLMRMKVPGASWNEENAILVAKGRAAYLSNRWEDLPLAC